MTAKQKFVKTLKNVDEKIDKVDTKLTNRLDKIGLQLANLEDDSPTVEDFDKLQTKVKKIERRIASV
ncbi:MAG TPA: hypothetical protein VI819_03430 [Patescibacteria group bacterium]|nr:hypothetical protein [Patescibacteria group bacterium]